MNDWQPTMQLRFVERIEFDTQFDQVGMAFSVERGVRILQQKWIRQSHKEADMGCNYIAHEVEWRDVPVECED